MEKVKNILQPKLWVKRYTDQLFKYAVIRIGNEETAKDLVQDTFLSALKNVDTFRGEISEKNWLFAILKNKIIDHWRQARLESIPDEESFFTEEGDWLKSMRPAPGMDFESKEFHEVLEKCKQKLAELQNAVFTLKYLDEKNSDEICKELEISSSNYWVLIHRAKLHLRRCLERNWFVK